jgi:hypothetical protein
MKQVNQKIVAIDPEYHQALVLTHAHDTSRSMKQIIHDCLMKDKDFAKQFKKVGGKT